MIFTQPIPLIRSKFGFTLSIMAAFILLQQPLNAQSENSAQQEIPIQVPPENSTDPENLPSSPIPIQPTQPENVRPLNEQNSLLSLQGGQRLMTEADNAIASENYDLASQKLQEARQIFNQLSNFYSQLAASFSGIDNRLADDQRTKALDTAQMRDQATYQLALVHRAQNQPELAVPLLVQIISSQQPTRDLGKKAYQQLLELGFVDIPYPRSSGEDQPPNSSQSRDIPGADL
ncbi:hypothetical protein [Okeania sp. SIO2B3]|uniref:hypothetical protein n=1 Tax=Okeania sp. SIO2B3 TaxID=2607784 RepID=UPI0013C2591E|nr:hypothetical protein [Okeania sp. SIO2B3]NET40686.1 hypothetical protein [Okeania sp. SIO2B3]